MDATFADLEVTYRNLLGERSSQEKVRGLFTQFLECAFWLTERAAGGNSTKGNSLRKKISDGNPAADACVELRNSLHDSDLRLGFEVRAEVCLGQLGRSKVLAEARYGEAESAPSTSATFPGGVMFLPCNPQTGAPDLAAIGSATRRTIFNVVPQRPKSEEKLKAAGTRDVHLLAVRFFPALQAFFDELPGSAEPGS